MVKAALTRQAHLVIGGGDWVANLTADANSLSVASTATIDKLTALQSSGVESVPINSTLRVSVPVLYYDQAAFQALEDHRSDDTDPFLAIIDELVDGLYVGTVRINDVPISASTTTVVQGNVEFPQSGLFYARRATGAATEFAFNSGTASVNLGATVPQTSRVFLVVTDYPSGVTAAAITVGSLSQNVGAAGFWDLGSPAASITSPSVAAAHTLTTNQAINGFLLVADLMTVD